MSEVRRFRHKSGFVDGTDYIEYGPSGNWIVSEGGSRKRWPYPLEDALERVDRGAWVEIPMENHGRDDGFGFGPGAQKLRTELKELEKELEYEVVDKRRVKISEEPGWFKPKAPGPAPADELDRYIQDNVVADTEIQVEDYAHKPNKVIQPGTARVVLFKDGRVALLTAHVGFFLSPADVDFIANLSQGQRDEVAK